MKNNKKIDTFQSMISAHAQLPAALLPSALALTRSQQKLPVMRWSDQALGIVDSERKITTAQEQHGSKNQYFLSLERQNQYFLFPDHQKSIFFTLEHEKSIFSVPGPPKINILCPRSTKKQYFRSPEH